MFDSSHDAAVRTAAFNWLSMQVSQFGDVLPRKRLLEGFLFKNQQVGLLSPAQGIYKPKILTDVPLSITTSPKSPYDDSFDQSGLLRYRYRGTDPSHIDNRGLRLAMNKKLPLIYFHGIAPSKYLAAWPVYVVRDHPSELAFTVAVEDSQYALDNKFGGSSVAQEDAEFMRRKYATALVKVRLHQRAFRERVLDAYSQQCSFCRLRHAELLDAAHIIPDSDPAGVPHVRNGLALCSLHHAAFDRNFIGLRPDLTIEIRPDILVEEDGPTMVHAIQRLHGTRIHVPHRKDHQPALDLVITKYERYKSQAGI